MMGYRVGSSCYVSTNDALDAYYSSVPPVQAVTATGQVNLFTYSGGAWKMNSYSVSAAGAWTQRFSTNAPLVGFPVCDVPNDSTTNFFDGMTLGWGVVLAMAIAWGYRESKRHTK